MPCRLLSLNMSQSTTLAWGLPPFTMMQSTTLAIMPWGLRWLMLQPSMLAITPWGIPTDMRYPEEDRLGNENNLLE